MPDLSGSCHCGGVRVEIHTERALSAISLRACQCGFCRRHGVKTFTDPAGLARIASDRSLVRYRFGKGTADFLLCPRCGTYIGAVFEDRGRHLATINVVGLQIAPLAARAAEPVHYEDEDIETRRKRRQAVWMPAVVQEGRETSQK
jgi:hypothetical protein